jgi:GNAT superfamily N-acetyltransferase
VSAEINVDYDGYLITTDKSLMNVQDIHKWLSTEAYWCPQIPFETVKTAFDNSYCIGAIKDGRQIAYGRLVTDHATFGYLADVYVEEEHRRKGISKQMMQLLFDLDWVKKLRHLALATRDAHELYKQIGFVPLKYPERYMQILRPDIYIQQNKP